MDQTPRFVRGQLLDLSTISEIPIEPLSEHIRANFSDQVSSELVSISTPIVSEHKTDSVSVNSISSAGIPAISTVSTGSISSSSTVGPIVNNSISTVSTTPIHSASRPIASISSTAGSHSSHNSHSSHISLPDAVSRTSVGIGAVSDNLPDARSSDEVDAEPLPSQHIVPQTRREPQEMISVIDDSGRQIRYVRTILRKKKKPKLLTRYATVRDYELAFHVLRVSYPDVEIPQISPSDKIDLLDQLYSSWDRRVKLKKVVFTIRLAIVAICFVIEIVGTHMLKLDIGKFAVSQIENMHIYDPYIDEFCKTLKLDGPAGGDGQWPLEIRFTLTLFMNFVLFYGSRMLTQNGNLVSLLARMFIPQQAGGGNGATGGAAGGNGGSGIGGALGALAGLGGGGPLDIVQGLMNNFGGVFQAVTTMFAPQMPGARAGGTQTAAPGQAGQGTQPGATRMAEPEIPMPIFNDE